MVQVSNRVPNRTPDVEFMSSDFPAPGRAGEYPSLLLKEKVLLGPGEIIVGVIFAASALYAVPGCSRPRGHVAEGTSPACPRRARAALSARELVAINARYSFTVSVNGCFRPALALP